MTSTTRVRTLLADDDPAILTTFKAILEREGCEVHPVPTAEEAVTALAQTSFDLVITDIRMERRDAGWGVVRAASRQAYRPIVVIVTAFPVRDLESKQLGVSAVLMKGTDAAGLVTTLRALIEEARQRRTSKGPANISDAYDRREDVG